MNPSDLIIIPTVLFGTEQLAQVLNAKQLLTSNGRLCLIAPVQQSQDILALAHASGLNDWIVFNNVEDSCKQPLSLFVGWSNGVTGNENPQHEQVIILQSPNPSQVAIDGAAQLAKSLSSAGFRASLVECRKGAMSAKGKKVISLLKIDSSFLQGIAEDDFIQIKSLILESTAVLWVSSLHDPGHAIATGLARVVRNEEPGLSFRTLHADLSDLSLASRFAENALRIFQSDSGDTEFMIKGGIIHVSRVVEDDTLNQKLDLLDPGNNKTVVKRALENAGPLKLCIQNPGLLDSLCFEVDTLPTADLEDDEVEITVRATSLK